MAKRSTTRMSAGGQVVIPEEIRRRLRIKNGTQFQVIGEGDAVILKTITAPMPSEFRALLKKAQRRAKLQRMSDRDIEQAVKAVRSS